MDPAQIPVTVFNPQRLAFLPYFYYIRNMEEKVAINSLAALAQGIRLRVFRTLIGAAPQGLTPGVLSAMLNIPASTLSFHLKELMHARLVSQERDGRSLIYRASIEQMNDLMAYLTDHCCHGASCAVSVDRRRTPC